MKIFVTALILFGSADPQRLRLVEQEEAGSKQTLPVSVHIVGGGILKGSTSVPPQPVALSNVKIQRNGVECTVQASLVNESGTEVILPVQPFRGTFADYAGNKVVATIEAALDEPADRIQLSMIADRRVDKDLATLSPNAILAMELVPKQPYDCTPTSRVTKLTISIEYVDIQKKESVVDVNVSKRVSATYAPVAPTY
jgi:hypothetical protein